MPSQVQEFSIALNAPQIGQRLDVFLTEQLGSLSRAKIQQLIKDGEVYIGAKIGKASYRLEGGEHIIVNLSDALLNPDWAAAALPEAIALDVIYEDQLIAAVNKPAGMVVHPAVGHSSGTLVNALLARWPGIEAVGGENRAGIVHRLDKETSGVILIAKTEPARLHLMQQFEQRTVTKRYVALVEGTPKTPAGQIDAPIGRDPNERKRMSVVRGGREALTIYKTLQPYTHEQDRFALLECFPKTGRTHQIRVHLAFIGYPIVGDTVYGRRKAALGIKRHFLHAESITLISPATMQTIAISAPLPAELNAILAKLEAI
jgi:23S rRNA pseudouridine1911/1915/1917 synthase